MSQVEDENLSLSRSSSISSTATAPNLPGAGRTVGLVLDWLGGELETFANKHTAKFNLSPEKVAHDVPRTQCTDIQLYTRQKALSQGQDIALSRSTSISTNATAGNLPGPGRTLGLFYDWVGKGLELFLNKQAFQFNLGPEAVACDIRRMRLHKEISVLARYAAPYAYLTKAQDKRIRKLCKHLLKYTRSHVRSTQLVALAEIIKLSMEDQIVREALSKCSIARLTPKYKEADLSEAISKAIYSVENQEIHELWTRFLLIGDRRDDDLAVGIAELVGSLKVSLSDPNTSFIAARYIPKMYSSLAFSSGIGASHFASLLAHYFDLTVTSPDLVEWFNVNACGHMLWCLEGDSSFYRPNVLEVIVRNCRSLMRFFEDILYVRVILFYTDDPDGGKGGQFSFEPLSHGDKRLRLRGTNNIVIPSFDNSQIFGVFLKALTGSEDYLEHISFLQTRDGQTRKDLKDIFIGNEILIIFFEICNLLSQDNSLRFIGCRVIAFHLGRDLSSSTNVLANHFSDRFMHAISLLALHCNEGRVEDRALAVFLMSTVSTASRYHKAALHRASTYPLYLSREIYATADSLLYKDDNSFTDDPICHFLWRFRAKGKYYFLCNMDDGYIPEDLHTECIDRVDAALLPHDLVLFCPHVDSASFGATGHYPIIAYFDEMGDAYYLAATPCSPKKRWNTFTAVKDGDSTAEFYDNTGRTHITREFYIMVLRHDPIDIPQRLSNDTWRFVQHRTGSLDSTGPIYWLQYFPEMDPEFFEDEEEYMPNYLKEAIASLDGDDWRHKANSRSGRRICEDDEWVISDELFEMVEFSSEEGSIQDEFEDPMESTIEASNSTSEFDPPQVHKPLDTIQESDETENQKDFSEIACDSAEIEFENVASLISQGEGWKDNLSRESTSQNNLAAEQRGLEMERRRIQLERQMREKMEKEDELREIEIEKRDREIRSLLSMPSRKGKERAI